MNIIGIAGSMGSGKDTVGKMIQYLTANNKKKIESNESLYDNIREKWIGVSTYTIKKFADKLKNMVCLLIDCTREDLEDQEFKNKPLGEEWNWTKRWWEIRNFNDSSTIHVYESEEEANDDLNHWNNYYTFPVHVVPCEKKYIMTPRLILQLLGTEGMRNVIHPNIHVNALFADYKPKYKQSYREAIPIDLAGYHCMCQTCGSHFNSKDKRAFMCNKCVDAQVDEYPNWIITDCRFENEAKAVRDRGGIVIKIERDGKCPKCGEYSTVSKFNDGNPITYCKLKTCDLSGPYLIPHLSETALDDWEFDYIIQNTGTIEELMMEVRKMLIHFNIIETN